MTHQSPLGPAPELAPEPAREPISFCFGATRIAVNIPDQATLLAEVARRFRAGQGFALATINLDHLVKLRTDPVFRDIYAAQDLVVADGNPVVWLSRLAGRPVALVPGSDMVVPLCRVAHEAGVPIALVGSTSEVLDKAAQALTAELPGLRIALCHAPPMGFDPEGVQARDILRQINAADARLCLVAMGAPKQEALARLGRELAPVCGFASIGAGLDFIAGTQRRAPRLMRVLALEWLWRMLLNPRRLAGRYLRCALVLPPAILDAWRLRRARQR